MDTLTFLSAKAIIDNFDFNQTAELTKLLTEKLNRMKVDVIKKVLSEELPKYEELVRYLPLVEKIDTIEISGDDLEIEFNDNPRYKILIEGQDQTNNAFMLVDHRLPNGRPVKVWKRVNDVDTERYLYRFGNLFLSYTELDDGTELEWGNQIRDFLSLDGKELKL